jgi:4-hydroxybenzoyl-CoA thioesterase
MQRFAISNRFEREVLVRFSHCDPAGIVFYPQYFILFNALVEDWFNEALGVDYAAFIRERRVGLPTVKITCEFLRPSWIGERLTMGLTVAKLGNRSLVLSIDCRAGEEERLRTEQVLVTTSLDTHRSIEIPVDLRARIAQFQVDGTKGQGGKGRVPPLPSPRSSPS